MTPPKPIQRPQPGRPRKDRPDQRTRYRLQGHLAAPIAYDQERLARASLFNELNGKALSDPEILTTYKAQAISEQGFKFLKDPMFLASTLFLKKVERLMALLMVMTVCLRVVRGAGIPDPHPPRRPSGQCAQPEGQTHPETHRPMSI